MRFEAGADRGPRSLNLESLAWPEDRGGADPAAPRGGPGATVRRPLRRTASAPAARSRANEACLPAASARPERAAGPGDRGGLLDRSRRRFARAIVAGILDRARRRYAPTAAQLAELEARLEARLDGCIHSYWVRQAPTAGAISASAATVAALLGAAAGVLTPAALLAAGFGTLGTTLAGLIRLANALEAEAEFFLVKEGLRPPDRGVLAWASRRLVDRVTRRQIEAHALDPAQAALLHAALLEHAELKRVEFWKQRAAVETAVLAGAPLLAAGIGVAAGFTGPAGVSAAVVAAMAAVSVNTWFAYRKLAASLEGAAAATLEAMEVARAPKTQAPARIVEHSRAAAGRVVERWARRHGLDDAGRAALAAAVERTRTLKVTELWQHRPAATGLTPLLQGAMTLAGGAVAPDLVAVNVGWTPLLALANAAGGLVLLYLRLGHALEASAETAVAELQRGHAHTG